MKDKIKRSEMVKRTWKRREAMRQKVYKYPCCHCGEELVCLYPQKEWYTKKGLEDVTAQQTCVWCRQVNFIPLKKLLKC